MQASLQSLIPYAGAALSGLMSGTGYVIGLSQFETHGRKVSYVLPLTLLTVGAIGAIAQKTNNTQVDQMLVAVYAVSSVATAILASFLMEAMSRKDGPKGIISIGCGNDYPNSRMHTEVDFDKNTVSIKGHERSLEANELAQIQKIYRNHAPHSRVHVIAVAHWISGLRNNPTI